MALPQGQGPSKTLIAKNKELLYEVLNKHIGQQLFFIVSDDNLCLF